MKNLKYVDYMKNLKYVDPKLEYRGQALDLAFRFRL